MNYVPLDDIDEEATVDQDGNSPPSDLSDERLDSSQDYNSS